MESASDILGWCVPQCATDMFADYGVTVSQTEVNDPMRMMAVIGFSGRRMHGSMALATSEAVVRSSLPFPEGCPNDWLGELANQLLGRVKNRLCGYGVDLQMAVPMVLRGLQLSVHGDERGRVMRFQYMTPAGPVCIWFDADYDEGLMLEEQVEQVASSEGAVLFF